MINKKFVGLVILFLSVCILISGCQLAVKGADKILKEDELKGVYITFKPLPTKELSDKDLENILNGKKVTTGNTKEHFYATIERTFKDGDETADFKFKDIEGIPFFYAYVYCKNESQNYVSLCAGPEISDHKRGVNVDVGEDLEGTIYIDSTLLDIRMYCNPVYETSDGKIYMTHADIGYCISGSGSQDITGTYTKTINGKSTSYTTKIKIKIERINPYRTVLLKQFNNRDEFLSATTITQKNIPKYIKKDAKTEYMIAETHGLNSEKKYKINREFVDLSEDTYDVMFLNSKGFAIPYPVEIK